MAPIKKALPKAAPAKKGQLSQKDQTKNAMKQESGFSTYGAAGTTGFQTSKAKPAAKKSARY